jgi:starch synthase
VGGIADVVRDLPLALADAGLQVRVITPAYGVFHRGSHARRAGQVAFDFGGRSRRAAVYRRPGPVPDVEFLFVEHALLNTPGAGVIYHDDGPATPFRTDATRFAFFSAAVAACVEQAERLPDILHLHDWHLGLVPMLRRCDRSRRRLRSVRTVFTIHNLAIQGIRPLDHDASSLKAWFPGLKYSRKAVGDPRYRDCVNPMAAAIRLADGLNTVSPGYAREIIRPSDPARGFSGGEGLDADLREAAAAGRLTGILNGCAYPGPGGRRPGWRRLLDTIASERHLLRDNAPARRTLGRLAHRRPQHLLTSIGRVSDQKTALFLEPAASGATALEAILRSHASDAVFIMLGSGDRALEARLVEIAAAHDNFLYLRGYSEPLPDMLYRAGDLFLMPSSFEPCGISQMLAMRSGQPCVVHAVGGLRDTVANGVNGFSFGGRSPRTQARQFVRTVDRALAMRHAEPQAWAELRASAAAARFSWRASANAYITDLYGLTG